MSDVEKAAATGSPHASRSARARMRRRRAAERRFQRLGGAAVLVAVLALAGLLVSVGARGWRAFVQHEITLDVDLSLRSLGLEGGHSAGGLGGADYDAVSRAALGALFPDVRARRPRRQLLRLLSDGAGFELRARVLADPDLVGRRIRADYPLSDDADLYLKGAFDATRAEDGRPLSDLQVGWLEFLRAHGRIHRVFNWRFLGSGDSREPELAGIFAALVGSVLTLAVALALSFPVGVAAAVYLEEFSRRGRWSRFLEVNINNLAAVPSIVFGLLGLAVFLGWFGLPRSSPLVGGMVLALMTLPTVIIASRAALQAVPDSLREAAFGIGASPLQTVAHHLLPQALPGILTGAILGLARALGETAPLLMIGMVAFIAEVPSGLTSPASALPVQIFLWADSPERAFAEKTSGAILVLLLILGLMNGLAVGLRHRAQRRGVLA